MASPRAALSVLKCLSPQKLQTVSSARKALSPKTPVTNTLKVEDIFNKHQVLPIFNIDTPNKRKIVREGLLDHSHTVLGNGSFGIVYKACYKGKDVAAKIIKNKNNTNSITMEKQATDLKHKNIINILKVDEGPALTLITMELCGNSLQNILEENAITKEKRIYIWTSIAKALKYCHKKGVVHADVKCQNVLIGMDGQPKLADFGSAVLVDKIYKPSIFHGTPGYAAPEVVKGGKPSPSSDVYSLAVVAWQMLSRKFPFSGSHFHTIIYLTGKGITPPDYDLEDELEGKYKVLYKKCWSRKYEDRPSLVSILKQLKELAT